MYAATLDPTYHGLYDKDLLDDGRKEIYQIPKSAIDAGLSFPYINFISFPFYHDRRQLAKVTCIQITETKVFFVWDAMYRPESIEFFRQLGMIGESTPPPRSNNPHSDDDDGDFEHGLFTTADTLAQAAADAKMAADEDGEGWDEEGAHLVASGSGAHTGQEQGEEDDALVAAPSNVVAAFDEDWHSDSDYSESNSDSVVPDDDIPNAFAGMMRDSELVLLINCDL